MQPRRCPRAKSAGCGTCWASTSPPTRSSGRSTTPIRGSSFPEEFVFVDRGEGIRDPFDPDDPISAGLQQVLFLFPGCDDQVEHLRAGVRSLDADGEGTRHGLLRRNDAAGAVRAQRGRPRTTEYVLAAHIRGKPRAESADGRRKGPGRRCAGGRQARPPARDERRPGGRRGPDQPGDLPTPRAGRDSASLASASTWTT